MCGLTFLFVMPDILAASESNFRGGTFPSGRNYPIRADHPDACRPMVESSDGCSLSGSLRSGGTLPWRFEADLKGTVWALEDEVQQIRHGGCEL